MNWLTGMNVVANGNAYEMWGRLICAFMEVNTGKVDADDAMWRRKRMSTRGGTDIEHWLGKNG